MTARKTWVSLACLLLTVSSAFAEDHWCIGCWQTGSWSGVCLRPDGLVTESDPDGNMIDIGRWYVIHEDLVAWVFLRAPIQTHYLEADGTYTPHYGYGYISKPKKIKKSFVPEAYDDLYLYFPAEDDL